MCIRDSLSCLRRRKYGGAAWRGRVRDKKPRGPGPDQSQRNAQHSARARQAATRRRITYKTGSIDRSQTVRARATLRPVRLPEMAVASADRKQPIARALTRATSAP
eukprot:7396516-Alexandrium_andersonii.AAC.1